MTDQIRLHRNVKDEFRPRVYWMTGQDFPVMLAAVKALPSRTYKDIWPLKYWLITGEGLKLLRSQGFTVTQEPDISCVTCERDILASSLHELHPGEYVFS